MRKMARCLLRRHGDRVFLADVVTGTLYREDTGQCMTSSARRVIGPHLLACGRWMIAGAVLVTLARAELGA